MAAPSTEGPGRANAGARLLRDRTGITRLLVLAELEREPGATLTDVARRLDVTVQAVSTYARGLVAQGLVATSDGAHVVTPPGLQHLHEGLRHLRGALDDLASPLNVIRVTSAVATARVRKGERVALVMEDGDLAARPRGRSSSTGVAAHDADVGDEVVVTDLHGLVALDPGALHVVAVPSPAEGGVARVDVPRLRARLKDLPRPRKVGAVGTGARILAKRLHGAVDFEFAADRAAFNAAERGLSVRLFVSRERLPEVMQAFDQLNQATLRRVAVESVDAPEAAP